jgi:excisionase family DNA binding protein
VSDSGPDRTFYSPREIAAMFRVSYHAVLRAIDRGDLEAERVFNRLRISSKALDAYRAARRVARVRLAREKTVESHLGHVYRKLDSGRAPSSRPR